MTTFRIRSLGLEDFRGIREAEINLDADIVLIYGRNGVGKSTVFDAIEYALFRSISRLERLSATEWERWIPHIRGNGTFQVRLTCTNDQIIAVGSTAGGVEPLYTAGAEFTQHYLLRERLKSSNDPAALHALLLATHLLTQSQMSELASSSVLDQRRLAALTGNDYLNACADAAQAVRGVLEVRAAALAEEYDRCEHGQRLAASSITRRDAVPAQHEARSQRVIERLAEEGVGLRGPISSPEQGIDGLIWLRETLPQEIVDRERRRATIDALNQATALGSDYTLAHLKVAFDAVVEERERVLAERRKAGDAHGRATEEFQKADERFRQQDLRRSTLDRCKHDLIRRERQASQLVALTKSIDGDTATLEATIHAQRDAHLSLAEETERLSAARRRETDLRTALTLLLQRMGELREAENHLRDATVDGEGAEGIGRLMESRDRLRETARSMTDCPLCGTAFPSSGRLLESIEEASRRLHSLSGEHSLAAPDLRGKREDAAHARAQIASISVDVTRELLAATRMQIMADVLEVPAPEAADDGSLVHRLSVALRTEQAFVSEREGSLVRLNASALEADSLVQDLNAHMAPLRRQKTALEQSLGAINSSLTEAGRTLKLEFAPEFIDDALARAGVALESLGDARESALIAHLSAQSALKSAIYRADEIETKVLDIERRLHQTRERQNVREDLLRSAKVNSNASADDLAIDRGRLTRQIYVLRECVQELSEAAVEQDQVSREANDAETRFAALAQRMEVLQEQSETHRFAIHQATEWEEQLRKRIADSVDSFVTPRNEEIFRCFSSLIPNAYRYDRLALRRSEHSLEMRLTFHDGRRGNSSDDGSPEHYLSAAQMSVLVVSIFLTLAEGQRWSNLDSVLLDDPVEHLDNLDAVAFLDGLRAFVRTSSKQLIISTCDYNLYRLMIRKFGAPWRGPDRSMIALTLRDDPLKGITVQYDCVNEPISD